MSAPRVGQRVRTFVEGVVDRVDGDLGHIFVKGHAPGQEHLEWEFTFHWATEFELLDQEGAAPNRAGDVFRSGDDDIWLVDSTGTAYGVKDGGNGDCPPPYTLLVRDGKPVGGAS